MINSIDEALNISDDLAIDDCVSLYHILQMGHENLRKFNAELKSKAKDKDGFYFQNSKYRIYNPETAAELIDFMILKNDKMLVDKMLMNSDPRRYGYGSTACINYGAEDEPAVKEDNSKANSKAKDLFLASFNTDNNKNKQ